MQLDRYQKAFVEATLKMEYNTAILLKSVAGSGKTHSVLASAKSLIEELNTPPSTIVLTSFTNNSARELATRFKKQNPKREMPNITTLHGLGRQVLNMIPEFRDYSIMNEWTSVMLMRDIIENQKMCPEVQSKTKLTAITRDILYCFSKARNCCMINQGDFSALKSLLQNGLYNDEISQKNKMQAVLKYQEQKKQQKLLDYDDMLWLAVENLKENSDLLRRVRELWKVFYIDEAQDLSQSQYDLVILASSGGKLVMVGDSCQSIYGFRDARPKNFSSAYIGKFFDDVTELKLCNNYRSEKSIVDISNLARLVANDEIQAIPYKQDKTNAVKVVRAANNILEGNYITQTIQKLLLEGYSPKDIIVICRTNRYIKTVIEPAFVNANIKYKFSGSNSGKKLVERDLVLYYTSALSLALNPNNRVEWLNLLSTCKGVGEKTLQNIKDEMIRGNITNYAKYAMIKSDDNMRQMLNIIGAGVGMTDPYDLISALMNLSVSFCPLSILKDDKNQDNIYTALCNYVSLQRGLKPFAENREIIQAIILEIQDYSGGDENDFIKLATVHSQKGCEAKVTFCCGFNSLRSPTPDIEEANILYVQLSRAIDKLYIIDSQDYVNKSGVSQDFHKNPFLVRLLGMLR